MEQGDAIAAEEQLKLAITCITNVLATKGLDKYSIGMLKRERTNIQKVLNAWYRDHTRRAQTENGQVQPRA